MNLTKLVLAICVLGFSYHVWHTHRHAAMHTAAGPASAGDFIPTAMPDAAKPGTVLILAPLNCPSEAARRADALAAELDRMGIPTQRSDQFSARISNPSEEQKAALNRAATVLGGEIPAVFINGMGKANPSAQEVLAEYNRTKRLSQ